MQYDARTDILPDVLPRTSEKPPARANLHGAIVGFARDITADPDFELIVSDPFTSFRWHRHDYPSPLARWNHHPEYEIHMITESTGKMFVGDHIGPFGPGNLLLVGPNVPHHWVSDIDPGQSIRGRDVVLQFTGKFIEEARKAFPEFGRISQLLEDSRRGIEFHGDDARGCGELLLAIGGSDGLARVALFVSLLQRMLTATEKHCLAGETYRPELTVGGDARIGNVIEYIFTNIQDVRMSAAAGIVGMTEFDLLAALQENDRQQLRRLRAQDPDCPGVHAAGERGPRRDRYLLRVRVPEHLEFQSKLPAREGDDATGIPFVRPDAPGSSTRLIRTNRARRRASMIWREPARSRRVGAGFGHALVATAAK